jgi:hypothetical protein
MGNMYYRKALENFISDDELITVRYLDSAVFAYQKGLHVLTESSVQENEKFYENLTKGRKREVRFYQVQHELEDKVRKINRKIERIRRKSDSVTTVGIRRDGNYYALIIGVSTYLNSQLNLDRPEKDARELRNVLTNHYLFDRKDVTLLLSPSRQDILKELVRYRKRLDQQDNLMIFYAGHGYWDEDARQGYWWPADATPDDPTFWLSNSDLRDQIRGIKTAHTLVVSDACFSGGILKTRDAGEIRKAPPEIILLYKRPSRRAITSGSLSAVPDQSVFFDYLKDKMVENSEKYISSQALFDRIRQSVIHNSMVVPQDGVILDTGDEGGDFIFIRKN